MKADNSIRCLRPIILALWFCFQLFTPYSEIFAGGTVTVEWTSYPTNYTVGQLYNISIRYKFSGDDNDGPWSVVTLALRENDGLIYQTIQSASPLPTITTQGVWYQYTFTNVKLSDWADFGDGPEIYAFVEVNDNDISLSEPDGSSTVIAIPILPSPGTPSGPNPADGSVLPAQPSKLDWANTTGAASYDVYLKVGSGSFSKVGADLSVSEWSPNQTYAGTSFQWYVVAKNAAGSTTGPTWSFSISPPPTVQVTSPNGGETLAIGRSHNIMATATGSITGVQIHYSTDGGANWTSITGYSTSTTTISHNWTVPNSPSSTCRVRVTVTSSAGNVSDASDGNFTIMALPGMPSGPNPADGTVLPAQPSKLDWANTTGAASYDVYLKVGSGSFSKVGADLSMSEWSPNQTYAGTSFQWYVVAKNAAGSTTGPTWSYFVRMPRISGLAMRPDQSGTPVFIQRYPAGTTAPIDPSSRSWVIIHGRINSSADQWVTDLAAAIAAIYPGDQILLVDWSVAANAPGLSTDEEDWIEPVGAWVAQSLVDYGFAGSDLNLIGHSWGGNLAAEIAEGIPNVRGNPLNYVNSIIALDPAENGLGSYNPEDTNSDNGNRELDFSRNSRFSWAFHSSDYGSAITPTTAHEAIAVVIDGTIADQHGRVINIFTHMLRNRNQVSQRFTLDRLLDASNTRSRGPWIPDSASIKLEWEALSVDGYEGYITAMPDGQAPKSLSYVSQDTGLEVTEFATIAPNNYTVSTASAPAAGGSTSGGGTFLTGSSQTVTATASTGYTFVNWTEGGNEVSSSPSYTFTVTGPRTLVANFIQNPQSYIISLNALPAAGGTTSGGGTYQSGTSRTVTATASSGFAFLNWTESGNEVSSSPSYTFTVTGPRTLVANFIQNPQSYIISLNASPAGGGTTSGGGTYQSGTSRTVTATASSGYSFVQWTEDGNVVSSTASYTFTLAGNRTLIAIFTADPVTYAISTSSSPAEGGTVSGAGTFASGSSRTVTATANSGYTFANWTEGGNVVSSAASYTFTLVGNRTLTATFTADPVTYAISTSSSPTAGGTVSGAGTFPSGSSRTVTATANSGYTFANWTEAGAVVSTTASYTFTLAGNRTLIANFTGGPGGFAIRQLPAGYSPGSKFTVTIIATPAANTSVYAIEDAAPVGWTVGVNNNGGSFDTQNGKVKFGPFFDATARTLIYELTPPADATGVHTFSGIGSTDGVESPIGGMTSIDRALRHPADNNPADDRITIGEATGYGAAWKTGATWPLGPNPIPIGYATRAGALWKGGETYRFDISVATAPLWWVNTGGIIPAGITPLLTAPASRVPAAIAPGEAVAELAGGFQLNRDFTVTLRIRPGSGVSAYAVEETVPPGWTVKPGSLDQGGSFDETSRKVKWGPFFDNQARVIAFVLEPGGNTAPAVFAGVASFDGVDVPFSGRRSALRGAFLPENANAGRTVRADGFRVVVQGEAGKRYDIQMSETPTVPGSWVAVATDLDGAGVVEFTDLLATTRQARFYRVIER